MGSEPRAPCLSPGRIEAHGRPDPAVETRLLSEIGEALSLG
jgi:hypothetical protein